MKLTAPIFRFKRRAKLLARAEEIPLHKALDQVARGEGFRSWSHLAVSQSDLRPAREILAQLAPGDLVLLGARPGHGKTCWRSISSLKRRGEGGAASYSPSKIPRPPP